MRASINGMQSCILSRICILEIDPFLHVRRTAFILLFQVMYGGFEVIGKLLIGNGKVFSASIYYSELFNGQDSMYIIT